MSCEILRKEVRCAECGNEATVFDHDEPLCAVCDQANCSHDDTDDNECLECGKDLTEDRIAEAYERAKAQRRGE